MRYRTWDLINMDDAALSRLVSSTKTSTIDAQRIKAMLDARVKNRAQRAVIELKDKQQRFAL